MRHSLAALMAAFVLGSAAASAGTLVNGVLTVNGRPFYPLGSWNSSYTSPADIARLGMNTCYWNCGDPSPKGVASTRDRMRACWARGLQFVAYVTPGPIETGWTDAQARSLATLSREPNLLAWYVGDDITAPQFPAMEQTVTNLRRRAPGVPAVADFLGTDLQEARRTYRRYVDIRCCYDYPVPDKPVREYYMALFDAYREFAGDPMWTWIQDFMPGYAARRFNLGLEGAGPIPDPEQVRLLAHASINRGVRGLFFFAHNQLHRLPEVSAEVALTCREVSLFNDELAAGKLNMNLPASDPNVNVAGYRYGASTVLSAVLVRSHYHRWIDEAVARNVSVECAWPRGPLPHALLVATPDVVKCRVSRVPGRAAVRVTIPALDLCGFILVTSDSRAAAALPARVHAVAARLAGLAPGAAAAQTRKVAAAWWQAALVVGDTRDSTLDAARLADAGGDAEAHGDYSASVRYWRRALRASRRVTTELMTAVEARSDTVPPEQLDFLQSPYALHNIARLPAAPARDAADATRSVPGIGPPRTGPWRYVTRYRIAGPFPLEYTADLFRHPIPDETAPPAAGFLRAYPPETAATTTGPFRTVDGPARWRSATTLGSGLLNLRPRFRSQDNVVAYARATVMAPRDMEVALGIGSNDGARVWVNGERVFSWWGARTATQNQNIVTVKLRKGPNTLLAKVANIGQEWQLYVAFNDPACELTSGAE